MVRYANLDKFNGASVQDGGNDMYATMPLAKYVDIWMTTFKRDSVKPATYSRLETSIKVLKQYKVSGIALGDITAFDLQEYVNELTAAGYGLTTIKKQLDIAAAPLRHAAAMHFIAADPTVGVKLPKENKVRKAARVCRPYTEEEQARIWDVIFRSNHPGALAIGLMLETGLRAGEVLALKWSNVDIFRRRLHVSATILNMADGLRSTYQDSPKSASSKRMVPLTPRALDILTRLQNDSEWVFLGRDGSRMTYEALRYQTQKVCSLADIPYQGEHIFRHTFATNCYYKGVDVKVLSRMLGHSDVSITLNIYVSLRDDGFDEMYKALVS